MGTSQTLQFHVNGYTGIDSLFSAIYSHRRMAKRVAIKAMRTGAPFSDCIPGDETTLILILPDGAYRIVDEHGNVETYEGQISRIGL